MAIVLPVRREIVWPGGAVRARERIDTVVDDFHREVMEPSLADVAFWDDEAPDARRELPGSCSLVELLRDRENCPGRVEAATARSGMRDQDGVDRVTCIGCAPDRHAS